MFWCRQTLDRPDNYLVANKRGTISLPNIKCTFMKTRSKNNIYLCSNSHGVAGDEYPFKDRNKWLRAMLERPAEGWPVGNNWSYEHPDEMYGSIFLDEAFFKTHMKNKIINAIDADWKKKNDVFVANWKSVDHSVYKC